MIKVNAIINCRRKYARGIYSLLYVEVEQDA